MSNRTAHSKPDRQKPQAARPSSEPLQRVVIVLPTYDEKENVSDIVTAVLAEQKNTSGFDLHVLVADSHSSDGTGEIAQKLAEANPQVHFIDVQERGIGMGLYKGITYAIEHLGAQVLVEMDADFQHNPTDIPALLKGISAGYDVVVGSRFVPGSINRMPLHRRILSVGANQVIRLALGLKGITEITTSYRAFTKEAFLRVDPETVPWHDRSFIPVPQFLVRMLACGARATEVPITMHPRTRGYSKMVYWKYICDILGFSLRSRLGTAASAKKALRDGA